MDEVPESEVLRAGRDGTILDGAPGGVGRALPASLVRTCLLAPEGIDPRGLRVRQARITGTLDIAGFDLPFPLRFEDCSFDAAPILEGARLHELALTGCALPGLLGNGLSVRRDLDLSGARVTGGHRTSASRSKRSAVWLCESDIGGRLLCVDTAIRSDGERAVQADRMHVGGNVRLIHRFIAQGEVRLLGARIDGSLDLTGAHLTSATGLALDLGDAVIEGSVFAIRHGSGRRPVIRGRVDMGSARIGGQVLIRDARLAGRSRVPAGSAYSLSRAGTVAVSAPRLAVGAEVTLEGQCEILGTLDLSMSEMSSLRVGAECVLRGLEGPAVDLTNAELRAGLDIEGAAVDGSLRLRGARIHGDLSLHKARLTVRTGTWAVAAQRVSVDGDVSFQDASVAGGPVEFRGAVVGGFMSASGASLDNPAGYTLSLHHAAIRGSVILTGMRSVGQLVLNRAVIDGRLDCTGAVLTCPGATAYNEAGHALRAIAATIRGGMDLGWASVSPSLDVTDTTTTALADNPGNWPPHYLISGFSYDRFGQPRSGSSTRPWDHAARIAWLDRQDGYDAGPYEHAAAVFRQHGHGSEAEDILIAKRRRASAVDAGLASPRRIRDAVYGVTVGYGYRPARVLWLIAALLLLVGTSLQVPAARATLRAADSAGDVYAVSGLVRTAGAAPAPPVAGARTVPRTDACGDGQVRCFSSVLYAVDTVIPLVSLDERSTWYPDPHVPYGSVMQWWLNAATLLGWLLSSIFVLSLARLARTGG
jgi:hypothetical protein